MISMFTYLKRWLTKPKLTQYDRIAILQECISEAWSRAVDGHEDLHIYLFNDKEIIGALRQGGFIVDDYQDYGDTSIQWAWSWCHGLAMEMQRVAALVRENRSNEEKERAKNLWNTAYSPPKSSE